MSQGYSGYGGVVTANGTDCQVQGWSADPETNTWDSTTTADGGWDDISPGTQKVTGSFDVLYNPSSTPFGGLGLKPQAVVPLVLYINQAAGKSLSGSALIIKPSIKSRTKEGITLTISFSSKGEWTFPT